MKRCNECEVTVSTPALHCPLCHSILVAEDTKPEVPLYPNLSLFAETYNIVLRVLIFLSITVVSVTAMINYLTFTGNYWSVVVAVGILYAWIAVGTIIKSKGKLGRTILWQVLSLAGLILVVSYIYSFSNLVFTYVLPGLFVFATLAITLVVMIRRVDFQSFVLYFILIALLGFVPLLLMAFDLVSVNWPSLVSAVYSGLSLVSLFIFADTATKKELRKRFHL